MDKMVETQKLEILNERKLNIFRRKSKKTQIFLYDTQRRSDDFVMKLKYRNNERYDEIPHYLITKTGIIYKLFDTKYSSKTFGDHTTDKKQIKIVLENLGWLKKNTITGVLNNWVDDPYRIEPFIKKWRGYFFWDIYPEEQIESLVKLCKDLCKEHGIPYQTVPSQGFFENATKFNGIVCKSNFQNIYTDINPSFDFKKFYNGK
jgi:N-acetyl-anhydromuramyl-L-alanine amidase AmpD